MKRRNDPQISQIHADGGKAASHRAEHTEKPGLLPVSKARGGLAEGFASLKDAIEAADLCEDRRKRG